MEKRTRRVKTRHIILAVMCLMYFISYIDRVNIAVAGPLIRHEMGLTTVAARPGVLGVRLSVCGDADHRRLARRQVRAEDSCSRCCR